MKFSIVRCEFKDCKDGVTHKWISSSGANKLWVCKKHFTMLAMVHNFKVISDDLFMEVQTVPDHD